MSIFWHLRLKMGGRDYLLQSIMHEWTYLYSLSDNLAQLRLRFFPSYGHENKVGMFLGPHITKVESRKINWESKLGHVSKREKLRGHDWLMIDRFSRDRKKKVGFSFKVLSNFFAASWVSTCSKWVGKKRRTVQPCCVYCCLSCIPQEAEAKAQPHTQLSASSS